MTDHRKTIDALLRHAGRTYADEAGIALKNAPAPLYRLLVLSVLLSTRIKAELAVAATRELVDAGMGTPEKMRAASWQQRVDALGRAHYRRYDETTATALGEGAALLHDEYRDDLRRLRERAENGEDRIRDLLTAFPRLGPVGADIFCREAQAVWPELRPALDGKALDGASRLGLPSDPDELAAVIPDDRLAVVAAALVRAALDRGVVERVHGSGLSSGRDRPSAVRPARRPG